MFPHCLTSSIQVVFFTNGSARKDPAYIMVASPFWGMATSVPRGCLVVTIPGELNDGILKGIRTDILEKIQATMVRGLILDLSTVRMMDTFAFKSLKDTSKMASLLGVSAVFVGLQPGVVSALVDLETEIADVRAALTIEDGFEHLQNVSSIHDEPEDTEDPGDVNGEDDENHWIRNKKAVDGHADCNAVRCRLASSTGRGRNIHHRRTRAGRNRGRSGTGRSRRGQ